MRRTRYTELDLATKVLQVAVVVLQDKIIKTAMILHLKEHDSYYVSIELEINQV